MDFCLSLYSLPLNDAGARGTDPPPVQSKNPGIDFYTYISLFILIDFYIEEVGRGWVK